MIERNILTLQSVNQSRDSFIIQIQKDINCVLSFVYLFIYLFISLFIYQFIYFYLFIIFLLFFLECLFLPPPLPPPNVVFTNSDGGGVSNACCNFDPLERKVKITLLYLINYQNFHSLGNVIYAPY